MDKKIMIIEDDKLLRDMMSRKLEKEGYQVFLVVDGSEGEKQVRETNPDVILLDLILPGVNGFELLETIKNDEALKDIPVIILSNLGQKSEVDRGMELGASDYLVKAHFTPGEIVEKLKKVSE
ncbi:MAG: response regulator transcription factor [Patescibacteria group bacterium]